MSYTKTTWVSGEQITATKLNNAENGIKNLDQRVENLEGHTGAFDRQSGNLLHIQDSIDTRIRDIILYGRSTQGGTPTPSAPVAINTAGDGGTLGVRSCGKNLLDMSNVTGKSADGITFVVNPDKSVSITASSSTAAASLNIPVNLVDGVTYTASGITGGSSSTYQVYLQNSDGTATSAGSFTSGEKSFTKDSGNYNVGIYRIRVSSGATFNTTIYPMIRVSGTSDTYETPVGTIFPVTVPSTGLPGIAVSNGGNYTDGTGQQWWCDTIDLGKGVYTQRIGLAVFGASSSIESTAVVGSYRRFASLQPVNSAPYGKAYHLGDTIGYCSHTPYLESWGGESTHAYYVGTRGNLYLPTSLGIDTIEAAQTWLGTQASSGNPLTMAYLLATPVEIPLTDTQLSQLRAISTLKDETYMYTDGGSDMYCEAYINEKDLYDGLEDDVASMLAKIAPEYSSSSTYNYAQLVTHNGNLYYCNTNIPTAEAWTSGHWTACTVNSLISDRALQSISNYNTVAGIVGSTESSLALGDLPNNRVLYISTNVHPSDTTKTAFTDEPFFRFFGLVITIGQNTTNKSGAIQIAMKGATNGGDDIYYRRGLSNSWHEWYKIITSKAVAPEYDQTATYEKGDYCTFDNKLYTCKNGIATPKAWSTADWTKTSVGEKLKELESRIAALEALILEN